MHPLSDKDLDRLSREAAEQFDVEQSTSGWDKLEHKLNTLMPPAGRKERRRFLFFIWLFALLSGGGLIWLLTGKDSSELLASAERTTTTNLNEPKDIESGKAPGIKQPDAKSIENTKASVGIENGSADPISEEDILEHENVTTAPVPSTVINQADHKSRTVLNNQKRAADKVSVTWNRRFEAGKKKDQAIVLNSAIPAALNENHAADDKIRDDNIEISEPLTFSLNTQSMVLSGPENPTLLPPDFVVQTPPSQIPEGGSNAAKKSQSVVGLTFKKGLEIGAVVSPDMSNVEFRYNDKVGFNVGLQIGYRFAQRWAVNTGVTYTRKNYTSNGKDFNPPKGSWLDNVQLDHVEGHCFMFDIPINIRYDLNQNNKQRVFVSTGLSSYVMKKEEYHYYYQYTNGSPGYRSRSNTSTERHWLGIVNLSAGFEKNINKKFSVQAEPYLKIPIQGIGYGNMQLNSYGMYFSLKYKPGFFAK
jgi:hypothetical protein